MALLNHYKHVGNLKLYDVRNMFDFKKIKPEFNRLEIDKFYSKEVSLRRVLWVNHHRQNNETLEYRLLNSGTVYNINTKEQQYPRIAFHDKSMAVKQMLDMFVKDTDIISGTDILVQFQRTVSLPHSRLRDKLYPHSLPLALTHKFHRNGFDKMCIICIDRENIKGGINQFTTNTDVVNIELLPGCMLTFDETKILHKVTEVYHDNTTKSAYRDVVLLASAKDPLH